jgi:hypothetical protein
MLNCFVFQIRSLKWKYANIRINISERDITIDNQVPFISSIIIKSNVAIGEPTCGTKNIKYMKNDTDKRAAPNADKKHIGENFSLKVIINP